MKYLFAVSLLITIQYSQQSESITCPTISCDSFIGQDVCFLHSGTNPVTDIKLYQCNTDEICDLTDDAKYAWVTSGMQKYSQGKSASKSQIFGRQIEAKCIKVSSMDAMLNNGRQCEHNSQCVSKQCNDGICKGKGIEGNCAQHSDCDPAMVCIMDSIWPFATKCQKWGTQGTPCNDDNECSPQHFCWYMNCTSVQSGVTVCMNMYQQPADTVFGWSYISIQDQMANSIQNGQNCKSGFAIPIGNYQAKCATITKIATDFGDNVPTPYKCTVTNPANNCRYYYDSINFLTSNCECGFDSSIGYCPYPGQAELTSYTQSLYKIANSSNCHTLDYANMRAQADPCGIGPAEELTIFIKAQFNFTNWPFIQNSIAAQCLINVHPTSYLNVLKSNSLHVRAYNALTILCFMFTVLMLSS